MLLDLVAEGAEQGLLFAQTLGDTERSNRLMDCLGKTNRAPRRRMGAQKWPRPGWARPVAGSGGGLAGDGFEVFVGGGDGGEAKLFD